MAEWMAIAVSYQGWSLTEIQALSKRERLNWLEVARQYGRVAKESRGL